VYWDRKLRPEFGMCSVWFIQWFLTKIIKEKTGDLKLRSEWTGFRFHQVSLYINARYLENWSSHNKFAGILHNIGIVRNIIEYKSSKFGWKINDQNKWKHRIPHSLRIKDNFQHLRSGRLWSVASQNFSSIGPFQSHHLTYMVYCWCIMI
jgi:hypothetical protein